MILINYNTNFDVLTLHSKIWGFSQFILFCFKLKFYDSKENSETRYFVGLGLGELKREFML